MRQKCFLILVLFFLGLSGSEPVFASNRSTQSVENTMDEEREIPKIPSAPAALPHRKPPELPECRHTVKKAGELIPCDSPMGSDVLQLRQLVGSVPAAIKELDDYRAAQERISKLAYVGTAGLILMLAGLLLRNQKALGAGDLINAAGNLTLAGGIVAGGFLVSVTSLSYGLSLVRSNEDRLVQSVRAYNQVNPKEPLELQIQAGVNF